MAVAWFDREGDLHRRIAIQHEIGLTADQLLIGTDPACQPLTPIDRVVVERGCLMQTTCIAREVRCTSGRFLITVSSPTPVVRSDRQRAATLHALLTAQQPCSSFRANAVRRNQDKRACHLHCPECAQ